MKAAIPALALLLLGCDIPECVNDECAADLREARSQSMVRSAAVADVAYREGRALTGPEIGVVVRSGRVSPDIDAAIQVCVLNARALITEPGFPGCFLSVRTNAP